jgi:hypothetical protein
MSDSAALPSFKRPPVNEVVLSVAFDRPSQFSTAHIGNFWHTRLRKELPEVEEQPAYNRPIETDGSTGPRSCRDSQDAPKPGTKSHTGVTRPDRSRTTNGHRRGQVAACRSPLQENGLVRQRGRRDHTPDRGRVGVAARRRGPSRSLRPRLAMLLVSVGWPPLGIYSEMGKSDAEHGTGVQYGCPTRVPMGGRR